MGITGHTCRSFLIGSLLIGMAAWGASGAHAACGATSCFVVIGSQQQIPQKGLLTINGFYNYTPQATLLEGTNGVIPAVDQDRRRLILDHHREIQTITQTYTLDLNYGVTDRVGLQLTVPFLNRNHLHIDGLGEKGVMGEGEQSRFYDNGLGDIRLTAKYNMLPTLRSVLVMGFGVELPTGKTRSRADNNQVQEAPLQLGRGNAGLIGSIYQTYELIPHRLNQFAFASYRHTFRNNDGYQFGDEYLLNAGVNLVTVPWFVLTSQFNYRYLTHDNMSASLRQSLSPGGPGAPDDPIVVDPLIRDRRVPNTGSTFLAYTPGFLINIGETTQLYFFSQIPVARDFNNNLAQGVSYVFGVTKYLQAPAI